MRIILALFLAVVLWGMIPGLAYAADLPDSTPETIEFVKGKRHQKPTVCTVDSDGGDPDLAEKGATLREQYCRAGIPAYPSVKRAARALVHLYRYHAR